MKKIYCLLTVLCGVLVMTGCKNGETYSDLKEAERDAINRYIQNENIKVISQAEFTKQGETTDVSMNEFVYLDKSGVYMQIVRQGCGTKMKDGETLEILARFSEYNIKEGQFVLRFFCLRSHVHLPRFGISAFRMDGATGLCEPGQMGRWRDSEGVPDSAPFTGNGRCLVECLPLLLRDYLRKS